MAMNRGWEQSSRFATLWNKPVLFAYYIIKRNEYQEPPYMYRNCAFIGCVFDIKGYPFGDKEVSYEWESFMDANTHAMDRGRQLAMTFKLLTIRQIPVLMNYVRGGRMLSFDDGISRSIAGWHTQAEQLQFPQIST